MGIKLSSLKKSVKLRTLNGINKKYNINFDESYRIHEANIIELFNYGIVRDEYKYDSKMVYCIGLYYEYVSKNKDLAKSYYMQAANMGNSQACVRLAYNYYITKVSNLLHLKYNLMAIDYGDKTRIPAIIWLIMDINKDIDVLRLFHKCYYKYRNEFEEEIENKRQVFLKYYDNDNTLFNIHPTIKMFRRALAYKCGIKICGVCKTHASKSSELATCEICFNESVKCIPYNDIRVCKHFTCVECHDILKGKKSSCPFCRQ